MSAQTNAQPNIAQRAARPLKVFVSVGEASGDEHAAGVIRSLLTSFPDAEVFGMGGSALRSAGMDTVVDSEKSAGVMGLTEVAGSLGKIIKAFRALVRTVEQRSPDVVVLVDFPDFNLRLAKALHPHCPRIVYFITPQLWAWRQGRVETMKKYVSTVIPIFPFEPRFYERHGVRAEFVGHPFADRIPVTPVRSEWLERYGLNPARPVLALLPGSRHAELERLSPVMVEAVRMIRQQIPEIQPVVAVAKTLDESWVREKFAPAGEVTFVAGAEELLAIGDAAIVASGTATVEAALARIPLVVVYKLSGLTYAVGKLLIRGVKFIAMPNLVAEREIVKELLQEKCTPDAVAAEICSILKNSDYREQMKRDLSMVCERLESTHEGPERTVDRVAKLIVETAGSEFVRDQIPAPIRTMQVSVPVSVPVSGSVRGQ